MDLFNTETNANLLPFDGEVNYYGRIIRPAEASRYLQVLLDTIAWKNDEAVIFGKHIITKRKAAWYPVIWSCAVSWAWQLPEKWFLI
jgi:hypothetical protein